MPGRQFKDLIFIQNWPGPIAGIIAGVITSFFLFGFWWPYWRIFDADIWMVGDAWLLNDQQPQEWFDHPGYFTILLLGGWFNLLHHLGLLDVHALSALPAPVEAAHSWTAAVRAGRVLSLLLTVGFIFGFSALLRRLIGDWRVTVLVTFALAFSGGIAMQARTIRTELIGGGLVTIALLLLLMGARSPRTPWRPVLVGAAALLATLGFINKVQMIFLICALPIIVLPFGCHADEETFWRRSSFAIPLSALSVLGASLMIIPVLPLIQTGLSAALTYFSHPFLLGTYGIYQVGIAIWIALSMVVFAIAWRVPVTETLAAMSGLWAGIALGLLSLDIRYNVHVIAIVLNPLEQLLMFATTLQAPGGDAGLSGLAHSLLHGIYVVFATRTFVLDTSARPTIFLEWLAIAGAIYAWKIGERRLFMQVGALMCVAWGMDAIYSIRSLQLQYSTMTDPLVIIAVAWLLVGLPSLQAHPRAYQIGALLIAIHLVLSQSEPVKHTFQTSKPLLFCDPPYHYAALRRIETYSFCLPDG